MYSLIRDKWYAVFLSIDRSLIKRIKFAFLFIPVRYNYQNSRYSALFENVVKVFASPLKCCVQQRAFRWHTFDGDEIKSYCGTCKRREHRDTSARSSSTPSVLDTRNGRTPWTLISRFIWIIKTRPLKWEFIFALNFWGIFLEKLFASPSFRRTRRTFRN